MKTQIIGTGRPDFLHARWDKPFCGALCLLVLAGLMGCKEAKNDAAEAQPFKVEGNDVILAEGAPQKTSLRVETAEPRKTALTHLTGRLYWNDDATVRIFTPVAGRVSCIQASLGDVVTAGEPLATIDSPDFGQALADARTADGNLRLAERSLARSRDLAGHGAAAQKDVETAEAAGISALSERDRTQARLALYGGSHDGTNRMYLLCTPLPGVIVEKNINSGQELRPDMMLANATQLFAPLFVVTDPARLWVQLDVSEADLSALERGQQLHIRSRAYPDRVFEGTLENIGHSLEPNTRMLRVRGVVNNPEKLLKAEMYVAVDVTDDPARLPMNSIEVPARAVFNKDNRQYLFVEESPGKYARREVKTGDEVDGKVLVTQGIKSGERVVIDGSLLLEAVLESTDKS